MNQASRALGWLRELLILTDQELPQALDTSGGIKPIVNVIGNGETFTGWRSGFADVIAGTAIGQYGIGLPWPQALPSFLPIGPEPGEYQTVIAGFNMVNIGASAKNLSVILKAPRNALDVTLSSVDLTVAAKHYSMREVVGDRKRIIVPPFCGLGIVVNGAAMPVGESVTVKYIYCFVPSGVDVGA